MLCSLGEWRTPSLIAHLLCKSKKKAVEFLHQYSAVTGPIHVAYLVPDCCSFPASSCDVGVEPACTWARQLVGLRGCVLTGKSMRVHRCMHHKVSQRRGREIPSWRPWAIWREPPAPRESRSFISFPLFFTQYFQPFFSYSFIANHIVHATPL